MPRIRSLAALAVAAFFAACTDTPTSVDRPAPPARLASSSACSPYLGGPTAVSSDSMYAYRLFTSGADCNITSVTWAVYGGTIFLETGPRIWAQPAQTTCMQVDVTAHYANGTNQSFTILANVDGYRFTCHHLA